VNLAIRPGKASLGAQNRRCCVPSHPTDWRQLSGAKLLNSAEQLLRRVCVVGAPSRLLGLRAFVAELVWEANTGAGA